MYLWVFQVVLNTLKLNWSSGQLTFKVTGLVLWLCSLSIFTRHEYVEPSMSMSALDIQRIGVIVPLYIVLSGIDTPSTSHWYSISFVPSDKTCVSRRTESFSLTLTLTPVLYSGVKNASVFVFFDTYLCYKVWQCLFVNRKAFEFFF